MRGMRVLVALAVALLIPAAAQARAADTLVIKVTSVSISLQTHDKAPKGMPTKASKGDTIVFHDNLLNAAVQFGKKSGAKVGTDGGTMTYTSDHSAKFLGTAHLPGGTLTLKGQVLAASDGKSLVIPVTGGTGRFKGAHGTVLVGPGAKRSLNTYTLVLPATGPVA
jgi:hypothetical protein